MNIEHGTGELRCPWSCQIWRWSVIRVAPVGQKTQNCPRQLQCGVLVGKNIRFVSSCVYRPNETLHARGRPSYFTFQNPTHSFLGQGPENFGENALLLTGLAFLSQIRPYIHALQRPPSVLTDDCIRRPFPKKACHFCRTNAKQWSKTEFGCLGE